MKKDCIFCKKKEIEKDIIHKSENLFLMTGFGLISPGQIMLVPKTHYPCFAEYPCWEEYLELRDKVGRKIKTGFNSDFFSIEYGVWGQSINHAHTHLIPSRTKEYEVKSIIGEMVKPSNVNFELGDIYKLRQVYKSEGAYVFIEDVGNKDSIYICHVSNFSDDKETLNFRIFFNNVKGLNLQNSWTNMTEIQKREDEEKRKLTKQILQKLI